MNILYFIVLQIVILSILFAIFDRFYKRKYSPLQSSDHCPICGSFYDRYRHKKIKYHITYNPEKWQYSCELCNEIEYLDRTGNLNKILENINNLKK